MLYLCPEMCPKNAEPKIRKKKIFRMHRSLKSIHMDEPITGRGIEDTVRHNQTKTTEMEYVCEMVNGERQASST